MFIILLTRMEQTETAYLQAIIKETFLTRNKYGQVIANSLKKNMPVAFSQHYSDFTFAVVYML